MLKNISLNVLRHSELQLLVLKRFAGHSKWQNIRHIKGEKDAEKSRIFSKISSQIKVAVHEGGSIDPKLNQKLGQLVEQARRVNMPLNTVQNIIKSCQSDKSQFKTALLEIKGPGSCFIVCDVYTDKLHNLKQNVVTVLKKHSSKLCDKSIMHFFEEKGIIEAEPLGKPTESEADILEDAMTHAIEAGAEDVKVLQSNLVQFVCGNTNLNSVVASLEKIGYKITNASVELLPTQLQPLNDAELELCSKLYEKLESIPEIVRISDNIA